MNSDNWKEVCELFTIQEVDFPISDLHIIGPDYTEEIYINVTKQDVRKINMSRKDNKATEFNGLEVRKLLTARGEGT
jgi:hypothetical protein